MTRTTLETLRGEHRRPDQALEHPHPQIRTYRGRLQREIDRLEGASGLNLGEQKRKLTKKGKTATRKGGTSPGRRCTVIKETKRKLEMTPPHRRNGSSIHLPPLCLWSRLENLESRLPTWPSPVRSPRRDRLPPLPRSNRPRFAKGRKARIRLRRDLESTKLRPTTLTTTPSSRKRNQSILIPSSSMLRLTTTTILALEEGKKR